MQARHGRVLAELTELGLELARAAQGRAMAAAEPKDVRDLTLAFQRASRCVRQTLALEAKLVRDAARDALEAREADRKEEARRVQRRRKQVEGAVRSRAWTEGESLDADDNFDSDLDDLLDLEAVADDFLSVPLETLVARICASLGVPESEPTGPADPTSASPPSPAEPSPAGQDSAWQGSG